MEKSQNYVTVEGFIDNWNADFPNYTLTPGDLKIPHKVVGALFLVFDRLGIDRDTVTQPPQEEIRNEHLAYYWDLIPVVNITRIINHLLSFNSQRVKINILIFLQPTTTISHSILLYLYNLNLFYEQRLKEIEPSENELFLKSNQVKILEDRKNKLVELLNEQAVEKGKRAERLEKIDLGQKQLEELLKQEKEANDVERQEVDSISKENKQIELMLEKARALLDGVNTEVEKRRALRVYDADDIKTKVEHVAQNVQEVEERSNSLTTLLMEKENNLKHLQGVTRSQTNANNLLHVITKVSEGLNDFEDSELDHIEGEMGVFRTEKSDLKEKYDELKIAKTKAVKRRQEGQADRQQGKISIEMPLKEAELKQKQQRDESEKVAAMVAKIKELTNNYKAEKTAGMEEIDSITRNFKNNLKLTEEELLKKTLDAEKRVEALRKREGQWR